MEKSGRPNFVFILIDDMGWKDTGPYGTSFYETPNLDKLSTESMKFTQAYAACPVCSPTRASILTGKYPATLQLTNYLVGEGKGKLLSSPYIHHLPLEEKSLASALKEGGYKTYHVGKWHAGREPYCPENHGFDVNIAGCHWGSPFYGYFSPYRCPKLKNGPKGEYLTDRLTNEAINLLRTNGDDPFFLYMSYYSVHIPIQAPENLIEKYRKKAKELGLDKVKTFEMGERFSCEHKKYSRIRRRIIQSNPKYAAMIDRLDENIGRLLQTIKDLDKENETIIVFTSDNGGLSTAEGSPTCNFPLAEGKGWMYEGGTREPLLIKWPGVAKPGSTSDEPCTSPDFYPTFLEIAGLDPIPEQHCDGKSLVPVLKGASSLDREAIFWHYPHYSNQGGTPGSSVRAGDYKLIEFFEDMHVELYNLKTDIGEEHDISSEFPEITERLTKLLHDWQNNVEAKIPGPNPDYNKGLKSIKNKIVACVMRLVDKYHEMKGREI